MSARPRGNTREPAWSIVVSMTSVLATLLMSAAAFVTTAMADEPVPVTATEPNPPPPESSAPPPSSAPPAQPATAAAIQAIDQRMEAYDQFRALYETARFDEALPLAQRVVELSESDRDSETELPIAFNNLGATQYQLASYEAAEASYMKIGRASCRERVYVLV